MPTLGYWAIRGLAQPIRLLLNYADQEFTDLKYEQGDPPGHSRDAWTKVKNTLGLQLPNLPYYIDEKKNIKITQSNAILRYIARNNNLLGSTEEARVKVDMMLDQAMDFRNSIVRVVYNPDYETLKEKFFETLPTQLENFETFLGEQQYFAGDEVTVCDFPIYELLDQVQIMKPVCLDKFPKLLAFKKRFEGLPKIKKYMDSPEFMKRPINNKSAHFK